MKISTKIGDKGESGLFNGRRMKKNAPVFELLGEIDEFQSFLGLCKCANNADVSMIDILKTIQLMPGVKSAGEGGTGFYVHVRLR